MKHVHFNEADIAKGCDNQIAQLQQFVDEPGNVGVQARMNTAVAKALHLAIINEVNRGSEIDDVIVGVVGLAAAAVMTINQSTAQNAETFFMTSLYAVNTFAECLAAPSKDKFTPKGEPIKPMQSGTA